MLLPELLPGFEEHSYTIVPEGMKNYLEMKRVIVNNAKSFLATGIFHNQGNVFLWRAQLYTVLV